MEKTTAFHATLPFLQNKQSLLTSCWWHQPSLFHDVLRHITSRFKTKAALPWSSISLSQTSKSLEVKKRSRANSSVLADKEESFEDNLFFSACARTVQSLVTNKSLSKTTFSSFAMRPHQSFPHTTNNLFDVSFLVCKMNRVCSTFPLCCWFSQVHHKRCFKRAMWRSPSTRII
jgi:hypothetical protein